MAERGGKESLQDEKTECGKFCHVCWHSFAMHGKVTFYDQNKNVKERTDQESE